MKQHGHVEKFPLLSFTHGVFDQKYLSWPLDICLIYLMINHSNWIYSFNLKQ